MADEKKKKAISRPKAMYPLRARIDEVYQNSIKAVQAGKPTGWCMVNWWEADPIIMAMGIEAVYPENYGAVCAAKGIAQQYLERSDAEGFPSHMCGYARNTIGYTVRMKELGKIPEEAPMGGMPKPLFLLGSGALCDTRFKWFQALGRYMDVPMWTVEMPQPGVQEEMMPGAHDRNIKFMVKELRGFIGFLEKLFGKKLDWAKLEEISNDIIEMNRIWHETNELRKARPSPMHSRDFWTCMTGCLYPAGDLKVLIKLYNDLYLELKERVDKKIGAIENEKYRMTFAELPPWHSLNIFDTLAERGWNFVVESWAYHPPKPIDLSKVSDPLERIARFTYQWLSGYYQNAMKAREWWGFFAYPYMDFVRDYQCDGALFHPLLTCRTATNHLYLIQDRLMQAMKVPSMIAEGDIVDLKLFDAADVLRRAETFEESMNHYKELRKKQGFEW